MSSTACEKDPELFLSIKVDNQRRAKYLCSSCPIVEKCFNRCMEYETLSGDFMLGTIGGTTQLERRAAAEIRRSA